MACVVLFVYAVYALRRNQSANRDAVIVVSAQTPKGPRGRYVDRAVVEFDASVSHYDDEDRASCLRAPQQRIARRALMLSNVACRFLCVWRLGSGVARAGKMSNIGATGAVGAACVTPRLLHVGAIVNARDSAGDTPLHGWRGGPQLSLYS